MSSSKKKQLRKEQYMTERQVSAAQEAKKLKRYTLTFWVVIALVVCIFIGAVSINPIKNVIYSNTDAVTVGNHTLSAVELNYFYVSAVNAYVNKYSTYLSLMGLDTSKPLDQQVDSTGATWASAFLTSAQNTIKSTYALYDLAIAAGHKLTDAEQATIDSTINALDLYAPLYGYSDGNAYLRGVYGNGANTKSYRKYLEVSQLANSYLSAYSESLEFSEDQLLDYDNLTPYRFNSYTYSSYYLSYSKFQEGEKDEKGNFTYANDDEKKAAIEAAREAALKAAEELAAGNFESLDDFDEAIQALDKKLTGESTSTAVASRSEDVLYDSMSSLFKYWVAGYELKDGVKKDDAKFPEDYNKVERKEGEMTVVPYTTGSGDSETINGYYVVRFGSFNDNTFALRNVRHILVAFEGGTYNSTTQTTTYSDEEKAKAKAEAEKLLAQWEAGTKTEQSFADLANKESDDGDGTTGGLYEDVYPGQMVTNFDNWVYDEARKAGDYGIIESEYGYHIIYFSGLSLTSYREYMVENALRSETVDDWYNEQIEAISFKLLTTKYVETDMVLSHSH